MSYTAQQYVNLLSAEHQIQPNFTAMLAVLVQPFVDNANILAGMINLFSLNTAVGQQLDFTGQWIGPSRVLGAPLSTIQFFNWDSAQLGWDTGYWYPVGDPAQTVTTLDDAHYRLLLQCKILDNNWNGSIPGAYSVWSSLSSAYQFFMVDNQHMSMTIGLASPTQPLDSTSLALLLSGKLDVKPVGVHLNYAYLANQAGPMFAFDLSTPNFAGFDLGYFATFTSSPT